MFEAQHVRVSRAANDDGPADAVLDHLGATQDQRAHQAFAELGFAD